MSKRTLLIGLAGAILALCSLESLVMTGVSMSHMSELIWWILPSILPISFGLLIGCSVVADIFPELWIGGLLQRNSIRRIKKAFKMGNHGELPDTLEQLIANNNNSKPFEVLMARISRPLRRFNYNFPQLETIEEIEAETMQILSLELSNLCGSGESHAQIMEYIKAMNSSEGDGKQVDMVYRQCVRGTIEESLALAVILMLKAADKSHDGLYVIHWPIEPIVISGNDFRKDVRRVLSAIVRDEPKGFRDYVVIVYSLVEISKTYGIPISFYVMEALKRGQ